MVSLFGGSTTTPSQYSQKSTLFALINWSLHLAGCSIWAYNTRLRLLHVSPFSDYLYTLIISTFNLWVFLHDDLSLGCGFVHLFTEIVIHWLVLCCDNRCMTISTSGFPRISTNTAISGIRVLNEEIDLTCIHYDCCLLVPKVFRLVRIAASFCPASLWIFHKLLVVHLHILFARLHFYLKFIMLGATVLFDLIREDW